MDRKQLILVTAICGGVAALGALLPWYSINVPFGGSASISGTESTSGVFVLLLGLAGGAAAFLIHAGKAGQVVKLTPVQHLYVAVACLAAAAIFTLSQFFSSAFQTQRVGEVEMGTSRGIGLWLCLLATLGGAAAAFMAIKKSGGAADPTAPA